MTAVMRFKKFRRVHLHRAADVHLLDVGKQIRVRGSNINRHHGSWYALIGRSNEQDKPPVPQGTEDSMVIIRYCHYLYHETKHLPGVDVVQRELHLHTTQVIRVSLFLSSFRELVTIGTDGVLASKILSSNIIHLFPPF